MFIFCRSCSFCTVLNAGRLVAPLIFAFAKFVPVTVAPEKSTFVKFAPENDTPASIEFTNDAPDKSRLAKLVPGVASVPASAEPALLIVIEQVAFVGALYKAVAACAAVIVTVPTAFSVTRPVVEPTVAKAVLLLLYVTTPKLALLAVNVNGMLVIFLLAGGSTNASVGVPIETVSWLLALDALTNCPETAAWDAVNVAVPTLTRVIQFPDASMVATVGLLLLYVIAPLLLLVGRVDIAKDASP